MLNVLSLFDGCSGAQVALDRLGLEYTYYASEIDKYAIKITQKNYPNTIQLGDIRTVNPFILPRIDLIVGGSPCQDLSVAGKQAGLNGNRSGLFFDFVRLVRYLKPKYFLLENVARMKKIDRAVMDLFMGVTPLRINSSLVSAQIRDRLYWTNIPDVEQPKDCGILLKDILESGLVDRDKSYCIDANYYKGGSLQSYKDKRRRQVVMYQSEKRLMVKTISHGYMKEEIKERSKYPALAAQSPSTKYLIGSEDNWRMLTPLECERLQTFPDDYTEGVSKTQRYKMLGNSFTVEVIKHILSYGAW